MKDNEYKCTICKGVFKKGWTDEEAMKECEKTFGKEMANNVPSDIVCDDCYQKIHPLNHPDEVLAVKKEFEKKV